MLTTVTTMTTTTTATTAVGVSQAAVYGAIMVLVCALGWWDEQRLRLGRC